MENTKSIFKIGQEFHELELLLEETSEIYKFTVKALNLDTANKYMGFIYPHPVYTVEFNGEIEDRCECSKCLGCGECLCEYDEYYQNEGYCPDHL